MTKALTITVGAFSYACTASIPCLTLHAYAVNLIIVGGGDSTNNRLYEEVLEAGYKVGKQLDVLNCLTIVSYAYFIESAVFFVSCIIAARSIA